MQAPAHASATARSVLLHTFGYTDYRGEQEAIVEHVSDGGDALVLMPTGAGKSLCFQIPALVRVARGLGLGIVVSPLIALMQDQVSALKSVGVRAEFLNSSLSQAEAFEIERRVEAGGVDILYVAPERLMLPRSLELFARVKPGLFAIDEAHCVSQWGHDFRPEYLQLSVLHEHFPQVPRIALTATADKLTRSEIIERLGLGEARIFVASFDRPNIRYRVAEKIKGRDQLLDLLRCEHDEDAGIVYCMSRKKVDETAAFLVSKGIKALPYHAGLESETRFQNQNRFLREDGLVMVATIAFGMGIDKPDVRFVAHLDMPKSLEGYYQETGRAGRDGLPATAFMVYGLQDVVQQRRMIDESDGSEQFKRVSSAKLDAMLGFCETAQCRRVRLLGYFDEDSPPCGNCDTCLSPPESFDGTVGVQKLLSSIYRTGQRFGAQHVIAVLRGDATEKVERWQHHLLPTFGVGTDLNDAQWRGVLRQSIALGLVNIDHERHAALTLTDASRAVLKGEQKVLLRRHKAEAGRMARRSGSKGASQQLSGDAADHFEALRQWRAELARRTNLPAYIILRDATLIDIARDKPQTLHALRKISGIGDKKLEEYGEALIALVAAR